MSQATDILGYIEATGSITDAEAVAIFKCYRLGARICDLRKMGVNIRTEMIYTKDQDGKHKHYAKYSKAV